MPAGYKVIVAPESNKTDAFASIIGEMLTALSFGERTGYWDHWLERLKLEGITVRLEEIRE